MVDMIPSKKKLIIFDLDDTLISSNIDYQRLRKEVLFFLKNNNEIHLMKKPISELLKMLENENPEKASEALIKIKELENNYTDKAELIHKAELIPDILDNYGLLYAILTNNTRDSLNSYLKKSTFSFLKKFYILTRDEAKMKPDPDGILKIINHFKNKSVTKENTLYIGDSFIDANACLQAEIDFVHFLSREVDISLFSKKPVYTLKDWNNVRSFIEKIS
jgi:HAD superfamily hydrolase (TIGR01549 family)